MNPPADTRSSPGSLDASELVLRVFVSSPGDVAQEREIARRAIARLNQQFAGRVRLDPVFWEHEPLAATSDFQAQIPDPAQMDIVVTILWARLGTRLPANVTRADGTPYKSGTEYEFERAFASHRDCGTPDLIVYRKTAEPTVSLRDERALMQRLAQKRALDRFVKRWFHDADGALLGAFHSFEGEAAFEELLEAHLERLIERRIAKHQTAAKAHGRAPQVWNRGSPFRGLALFEQEHAEIFFGRTRAVGEVLHDLRQQAAAGHAFVLILGDSGTGKSSLARAGVLPMLCRPGVIEGVGHWRTAVMRPSDAGADFVESLVQALVAQGALPELLADGATAQSIARDVHGTPQALATLVASSLTPMGESPGQSRLVVLVDQLEEMFVSADADASQREKFIACLHALATSGQAFVLATIRSDFYARCAELPLLLTLKEGAGQYDLRPPSPSEISQIIERPAQLAGLRFELAPGTDEQLDETLRAAVVTDQVALPLLEFTLDELYRAAGEDGVLTFDAYAAIGGIEGALTSRAEAVLAAVDEHARQALPGVLEALIDVTVGANASIVRRRALRQEVANTPQAARLLDALIEGRLVVATRSAAGEARVSVAHEALLHHWDRIQEWIDANHLALQTRSQVAAAATIWADRGRADDFLLPTGSPLQELTASLGEPRIRLSPLESEFLEASERRDATHRRRHRSSRRARLGLALAAIIAAVITIDGFVLLRSEHYSTSETRWGAPIGAGMRLSAQQIAQMPVHHKLTTRGRFGRVVRIETLNPRGTLVAGALSTGLKGDSDTHSTGKVCAIDVEYSPTGQVTAWVGRNRSGHVLYRAEFSYPVNDPSQVVVTYKGPSGLPFAQTTSGASIVEFTRDARGFSKRERYLAPSGAPVPDADGFFGYEFSRNERGEVTEQYILDEHGDRVTNADGYFRVNATRNAFGEVSHAQYFDREGAAVTTSDGNAGFRSIYEQGRLVRDEILGLDGGLIPGAEGYAVRTNEYQDGLITRESYLDVHLHPTLTADGYASATVRYDSRGDPVEWRYFDVDNRPVARREGYHRELAENDRWGNATKVSFYDLEGRPALNQDGYSITKIKYDDGANAVAWHYFNALGDPTIRRGGYAAQTSRVDDAGREIAGAYLGTDNQPIAAEDGYASWKIARDLRGNRLRVDYFDAAGEPTLSKAGYAIWTARYDDHGNQVEEAWLGVNGERLLGQDGAAGWRAEYDRRGNELVRVHLDEFGEPTTVAEGYAIRKRRYDAQGRVIETQHFDVDGHLTEVSDGYASLTTQYDARGNEVEIRYFDSKGNPTKNVSSAAAIVRHEYDDRRHSIGSSYFDEHGDPGIHINGYHRVFRAYDAGGNITLVKFFGPGGKPVTHKEGYAEIHRAYDSRGNKIKAEVFDLGGDPTSVDGSLGILREYDSRGNLVKLTHLDAYGEPTIAAEGYAILSYVLSATGMALEDRIFDDAGDPIDTTERSHLIRNRFDTRGNLVEARHFDALSQPTNEPYGYHRATYRYNNLGQAVYSAFFGRDGEPAQHSDGGFAWRSEYDLHGRVVEGVNLDLQGQPAPGNGGWTIKTWQYDRRGSITEIRTFDENRQPVALAGGHASLHYAYDGLGNPTRWECRDAAGELIVGPDGYAIAEARYDPRGRQTWLAYYGADGQLMDHTQGFASEETVYGDEWWEVDWVYRDASGDIITPTP